MKAARDWKNFETTGKVEAYLNYLGKCRDTNKETYGQTVEHQQTGDVNSERFCFSDRNGLRDRTC